MSYKSQLLIDGKQVGTVTPPLVHTTTIKCERFTARPGDVSIRCVRTRDRDLFYALTDGARRRLPDLEIRNEDGRFMRLIRPLVLGGFGDPPRGRRNCVAQSVNLRPERIGDR